MKTTWTTAYISDGFECVLGIEGDDINAVLAEAKRVLAEMGKHGVKPLRSRPVPPAPHREMTR